MEFSVFFSAVGAAVLANVLTILFVYALWRFTQEERAGRPVDRLPFWVILCGLIPPLFAAWCISLMVISSPT